MNLNAHQGLVISISGGKDSQTIMGVVLGMAKTQNYSGKIIAVHADTGAEWPQSLPHCRLLCDHYQIPLEVAVPFRALPDHIERRARMIGHEKPFWPSSACRYCTSDCKRSPIQKVIRKVFPSSNKDSILSITGERREESSHRAKLSEIEENKMLTTGGRTVLNYRPILDYKIEQVWKHISDTGIPRHAAYDLGNERLSCSMCVLATDNDIRNGALADPALAERYLKLESETGKTFKNGKSLASILAQEAQQ